MQTENKQMIIQTKIEEKIKRYKKQWNQKAEECDKQNNPDRRESINPSCMKYDSAS